MALLESALVDSNGPPSEEAFAEEDFESSLSCEAGYNHPEEEDESLTKAPSMPW
jgi:hypothetical protein